MSFILDALQKDQVEQQPQAVPTGTLPPPRPSRARRWGAWIIGVALLVNAGVVAWYLLGQQSNSSGQPNFTDVEPSVPGAQRELAMAPPTNRTSSQPVEPSANSQPNPIPKRVPDRSPTRNTAAPTRDSSKGNSRPPPSRTPAPAPAAAPTSSTASSSGAGRVLSPEQAAQMGIGDDLLDAPKQTAEQPVGTKTAERRASDKAKSSTVSNTVTIAELPTAARNSFPQLEFSTHIFADDPSMRAVVVNDKRLTEGEQLGELILRAVTEEGVVFGYRNHRVAVSVVDLWAE